MMFLLVFDTTEDCNKFLMLYENYKRTTEYTIRRFIQEDFTVEDLMQEIFLIIARNLDKIDEDDETKTRNYIITISRNYCKSYLRKQKRAKEDFIDDIDIFNTLPNDSPEIIETLMKKETYQFLCQEIKSLDDKYRIALELKYINDLDDTQIAHIMGTTKKNIQMRIYRAKLMLRKSVGEINL